MHSLVWIMNGCFEFTVPYVCASYYTELAIFPFCRNDIIEFVSLDVKMTIVRTENCNKHLNHMDSIPEIIRDMFDKRQGTIQVDARWFIKILFHQCCQRMRIP